MCEGMTVSEEELEIHLARLRARKGDKRAGLYGPGTVSWEVNREGIIMLGGGCAALMQLAHPFVAHAIDQHSQTRHDPLGRFQRTFDNVFAMVFGDVDQAIASARRVHAVHRTIRGAIPEDVGRYRRGDRYHANHEPALLWVHATLLDTALRVFELLVRPLSPLEREAYYAESKLFAYLFGLGDDDLPASWTAFEAWYARTIASDTIAVGEPAKQMRRFLLAPPTPAHAPLSAWFEIFTAGLLPPKLRDAFGFRWGRRERLIFAQSRILLRTAQRVTPGRLKYFPAYVEARRRLAGKVEHDPFGRWLEAVALRSLRRAEAE